MSCCWLATPMWACSFLRWSSITACNVTRCSTSSALLHSFWRLFGQPWNAEQGVDLPVKDLCCSMIQMCEKPFATSATNFQRCSVRQAARVCWGKLESGSETEPRKNDKRYRNISEKFLGIDRISECFAISAGRMQPVWSLWYALEVPNLEMRFQWPASSCKQQHRVPHRSSNTQNIEFSITCALIAWTWNDQRTLGFLFVWIHATDDASAYGWLGTNGFNRIHFYLPQDGSFLVQLREITVFSNVLGVTSLELITNIEMMLHLPLQGYVFHAHSTAFHRVSSTVLIQSIRRHLQYFLRQRDVGLFILVWIL